MDQNSVDVNQNISRCRELAVANGGAGLISVAHGIGDLDHQPDRRF